MGILHDWLNLAACNNSDPDMFFSKRNADVIKCKKICNQCPVKKPCLQSAIKTNSLEFGIHGGFTGPEFLIASLLTGGNDKLLLLL